MASSKDDIDMWENVIAVVILCRGGENKISNDRSYIILPSGEHVTSFTENNSANFSSEKWSNA